MNENQLNIGHKIWYFEMATTRSFAASLTIEQSINQSPVNFLPSTPSKAGFPPMPFRTNFRG